MALEAAELLALALALEEDEVPEERAVEELTAGAEGSVVALTAAHAHAVSLARALPYDEQAQRTVALLEHALRRVDVATPPEQPPEDVESWLRPGGGRMPAPARQEARTPVHRLADLTREEGDADRATTELVAELDRLRNSAAEEAGERRRTRWWRP